MERFSSAFLTRRCLAKDPEERWQMVRDLVLELKWIADVGPQADAPASAAPRRRQGARMDHVGRAAFFALTTMAFAIGFVLRTPKVPQPVRLTAEIGAEASLMTDAGPAAVLSPSGDRVIFRGPGSGQKTHILRSLARLASSKVGRGKILAHDNQKKAHSNSGNVPR